ncbi:hypothetical protein AHAS_Ahas01G0052400 [Arachis hypogaea]
MATHMQDPPSKSNPNNPNANNNAVNAHQLPPQPPPTAAVPPSSTGVTSSVFIRGDGCEGGSPNAHHRRAHSERDTTGLSSENTELKLRLQAMEQQAQLRDALNDALMKEVERLKIATGEAMKPSESFNLGMQQMQFAGSNFFPVPQSSGPPGLQSIPMMSFCHPPSNIPHEMQQSNSHQLADILHNDQLGRLQGLDISSKGSTLVKAEGPSLSASESSNTF